VKTVRYFSSFFCLVSHAELKLVWDVFHFYSKIFSKVSTNGTKWDSTFKYSLLQSYGNDQGCRAGTQISGPGSGSNIFKFFVPAPE